jgi:hypothetical protein
MAQQTQHSSSLPRVPNQVGEMFANYNLIAATFLLSPLAKYTSRKFNEYCRTCLEDLVLVCPFITEPPYHANVISQWLGLLKYFIYILCHVIRLTYLNKMGYG